MSARSRAMEVLPDPNWQPRRGEEVYLPPRGIGRHRDRGVVLSTGARVALVRANYGWRCMRGYFTFYELRPIDARTRAKLKS